MAIFMLGSSYVGEELKQLELSSSIQAPRLVPRSLVPRPVYRGRGGLETRFHHLAGRRNTRGITRRRR